MIKPNRTIDRGGTYFAEFGEPCQVGTASVYMPVDLMTDKFPNPTINWSCVGEVSIEQAEEFMTLLKGAISLAKKMRRTRTGKFAKIQL
jgi:hypothetical protein